MIDTGAHNKNEPEITARVSYIDIHENGNLYNGPDAAVSSIREVAKKWNINGTPCLKILTLTAPIEFSWKIRPVCLPSDPSVSYEGEVAQATGWGRIEDNAFPTNLMKVDVKVISIGTCQNSYRAVTEYVKLAFYSFIPHILMSSFEAQSTFARLEWELRALEPDAETLAVLSTILKLVEGI